MNRTLRGNLRAAAASGEMALRSNVMDSFVLFGLLVQPLIIAVLALWMLEARGENYAIYVVIGSGLTGLWSTLLFVSGNGITSERWTGTLESLTSVPTPMSWIIMGKTIANVTQSLVSMVAAYALASLLFGYPLTVTQPVPFLISIVFMVLSFVAFGMLIAPAFVLNPDVQRWQNAMEFPVYILAGFLFPIALLPGWTTPLSYLLAPYWAARALHITSSLQGGTTEVLASWGMMVVLAAIYLVIARRLFRLTLQRARQDASLGMQ
jgi:ABC-2 type transport system permease protein